MAVQVVKWEREPKVSLDMARADAEQLFHDLNRVLALIDEVAETRSDGNGGWQLLDSEDQAAYDRANEVLATMQRELQIEPR